eukprot:7483077-Pyramimonas_sp.AAC.1
MASSTLIVSDAGMVISWLKMPPKDVRKLLILGVQRWQGRRILEHHAEHLEGGESLWMRAVHLTVGGEAATIKNAQVAGALRCLWAGGYMT